MKIHAIPVVTFILFSTFCILFSTFCHAGDLDSDLVGAVLAGDLKSAESLLSQGANPNLKNIMGRTALHLAASKGNTEMADLLISNGADIGAADRHGLTPLHVGALAGEEIIILLVNKGADVNAKDKFGATPLHAAAKAGNENAVLQLIALHADLFARDQEGGTPADWAEKYGHAAIVKLLKENTQEAQYGNCHHYIYHQITGQYAKRRVEYEELIKTLDKYQYKLARTFAKFSEVKTSDLKTGDVILIGWAHSGIVRKVSDTLKVYHFRGKTDWGTGKDKDEVRKRSDWIGLDYGLYVHAVEEIAKMKASKGTYGDLQACIYQQQISGNTFKAPILRIDSTFNDETLEFDDKEVKIGEITFAFNKDKIWGRLDIRNDLDGLTVISGEFSGKIEASDIDNTSFPIHLRAGGTFNYSYHRDAIMEDGEVMYVAIDATAQGELTFYAFKYAKEKFYSGNVKMKGEQIYNAGGEFRYDHNETYLFKVSLPD